MSSHFSAVCDPIEEQNFHAQKLQLIHQTLAYLKDPLTCRKDHFSTCEEWEFFTPLNVPSEKEKIETWHVPPLPRISPVLPLPTKPQKTDPVRTVETRLPPKQIQEVSFSKVEEKADYMSIKKVLQKICPSLKLYDSVLEDIRARKIKNGYKELLVDTEVVILLCDLSSEWVVFAKNLAKAIDERLAKIKVISAMNLEREKRWDLFFEKNQFRLILASDQIHTFPQASRYYQEKKGECPGLLGRSPLLLLSSPSTYNRAEQKMLLWNQLCQLLQK